MCALFYSGLFYGQALPTNHITPNSVFDKVVDDEGNQYQLTDLKIKKGNRADALYRSAPIACSTTSYFNLFFENGSGFETVNDVAQDLINTQRRQVLCKVFEDISNFIQSPLTGSPNRVNIWVRNINNNVIATSDVLGLASGFYNVPSNATSGGIADNEIWKTIHTGTDSYANVASPLTPNSANAASNGTFYHGMVAFNFNTTQSGTPIVAWHTTLTAAAPLNKYDLYTVALHEIVYALGFASFINVAGNSKMGSNFQYYSRYDKFLKNNIDLVSSQLLINSSSTCSSSMYDFRFNPNLLPNILQPQTTPPSACQLDNTVCGNSIFYHSNGLAIPVYTPNCFSNESSLSHFEDQCFPTTGTPYGNDAYSS